MEEILSEFSMRCSRLSVMRVDEDWVLNFSTISANSYMHEELKVKNFGVADHLDNEQGLKIRVPSIPG